MRVATQFMCLLFQVASAKAIHFKEAMDNIREAIQLYLEPVDDDLVLGEKAEVEEIDV